MKDIAKESGHWYKRDGEPCYEIEGANGKIRSTTLRDARKLDLLPSVTTILSVYPKHGLIEWQKKQVLYSALTLTRLENESDDSYIMRILEDSKEHAKNAAERGTAIHGAIERYLLTKEVLPLYKIYVESALKELWEYLGEEAECEPEKSFSSPLRYGGKVDLHSKQLNFVADFKTKEFDESTKKLQWDEQKMQLEAYRHGLDMPTARMLNVYISTSNPGLVKVVEHKDDGKAWNQFKACLAFWQGIKNYN